MKLKFINNEGWALVRDGLFYAAPDNWGPRADATIFKSFRLADAALTRLLADRCSYVEIRSSACHAGSDGDCNWSECPQEANNRANYQSICPLTRLRNPHLGEGR